MGTGVAYVQFVSSEAAEQAQNIKHKQMMGTRYIECMILIPGQTLLKTYTLHLQAICTHHQCSVHIIALFVPPVTDQNSVMAGSSTLWPLVHSIAN